jgi:cell division protein FtsL
MPRKIRSQKAAPAKKMTRGEIMIYVVGVIVALSMVLGTVISALGR